MRIFRAAWVLPIATPPVRDGWVAIDGARVVAVGGPEVTPPSGIEHPPESIAIMPALVNAHTHLEFSWARGCIPPAASMPDWVADLMARRRARGEESEQPISAALREVRACGTGLLGEVSNTLASYRPLLEGGIPARVFYEVLGFNTREPWQVVSDATAAIDRLVSVPHVRFSVVPHAPYSVAPELFRAVAAVSGGGPVSVHVGESAEEIEFLHSGSGPWRVLLEEVGAWDPGWKPPGCGPVEYLDRFGLVNDRLLAVHCVQVSHAELARLAAAGATVVTCPRSNRWTGAGVPPVDRFYASGVRVAVGTDSLASVDDLNLFQELAAIRALAPDVPARRILESATRHGADALGFGQKLGTIEPGKCAALLAVRVPDAVEDVEEYLVGGVRAEDVAWVKKAKGKRDKGEG